MEINRVPSHKHVCPKEQFYSDQWEAYKGGVFFLQMLLLTALQTTHLESDLSCAQQTELESKTKTVGTKGSEITTSCLKNNNNEDCSST